MYDVRSKSLRQTASLNRCVVIPTSASSNIFSVLLRGLVFLTAVTKENILSIIALLAGVMRQVKAYVVRSL